MTAAPEASPALIWRSNKGIPRAAWWMTLMRFSKSAMYRSTTLVDGNSLNELLGMCQLKES